MNILYVIIRIITSAIIYYLSFGTLMLFWTHHKYVQAGGKRDNSNIPAILLSILIWPSLIDKVLSDAVDHQINRETEEYIHKVIQDHHDETHNDN